MKKTSFAILSLALALASPAFSGPADIPPPPPPLASDAGFYFGADGGLFFLQDRTFNSPLGLPISADVSYKTGWGVTVPLGYNFGNGLSIGVSGGYYEAKLDSISVLGHSISPGQFGVSAKTQFVPIMAEVSYSLHLVGALSWDIGGGIGTGYTRDSVSGYGLSGYDTDWSFAFEATTGLSYKVCPNAAIRLGYRYYNSGEAESSRLQGHALELGFRLDF